jgi:hypothetical protein
MLAFPGMLVPHASPFMPVPENIGLDGEFNSDAYPHFTVCCNVCLGVPTNPERLRSNAEIIGKIPEDRIRLVTAGDLESLGVEMGT